MAANKKIDFTALHKEAKKIYKPKSMTYAEAVKKAASSLKKSNKLMK